jgi:hypothetical protein
MRNSRGGQEAPHGEVLMPKVIRYTVEDIMRVEPCASYPRECVIALWGGKESLSPADIARLPIPVGDRLGALWNLLYRLSRPRARRVARFIAHDVIDLRNPTDVMAWVLGTCGEQTQASGDLGSVRPASLSEYLSWVVKAFGPFTPVGGLS